MVDVLFILTPHTLLLDVAGPAEAFRMANQQLQDRGHAPRFNLRFAGPKEAAITSVGLTVTGLEPLPKALQRPTWLVLMGQPSARLNSPDAATRATVQWLAQAMQPALADAADHRLVTICAGTLLAAQAGLLGTRRCTTHHDVLATLKAHAPLAQVIDNRVFVIDGALASSAGVTAGIDLTLHLIAMVCGDGVAAAVAKNMVVYLRRSPNDPELSPLLAHRHHLHPAVHRAQDAVSAHPSHPWDMPQLAATACVTERHLLRLFTEHAGVSPLRYLEKIRLEQARQALARGDSVTRAAETAGFSSDLQLRRAWARHLDGTPATARASGPG
jgi:transcriptional regulator GlxA family with amidase domain